MSERQLRRLTQAMEGIEQDDQTFEAQTAAWFAAVRICDYVSDTEQGTKIRLNIHGEPYQSSINHDPELVAAMVELYQQELSEFGLQTVRLDRPTLEGVITLNPFLDDPATRQAYLDHFNEMLEGWGFRSIREIGPQPYLDQVPDYLDRVVYRGPDGFKTVLNGDGFVAERYDIEPNPDRPNGQRGVSGGRPRYQSDIDRISKQLSHLAANKDRFTFDATDDLGYRPIDQSDNGVAAAWDGWDSSKSV